MPTVVKTAADLTSVEVGGATQVPAVAAAIAGWGGSVNGSGSVANSGAEETHADTRTFEVTPVFDLSEIPSSAIIDNFVVEFDYTWSISGSIVEPEFAVHFSQQDVSSEDSDVSTGSGHLSSNALVAPISKAAMLSLLGWLFYFGKVDPATVDDTIGASFAVDDYTLTVDYTLSDVGVSDPIPHLETSEAQAAVGPIPSSVTISGELVGDDEGLYPSPTYLWEFLQGPLGGPPNASVLISTPTLLETGVFFTAYTAGVYVFRLTATQSGQPSLTATTQVTLPSAQTPRVRAETHVTTYPVPVTVDPAVTDDGWNGLLTYAWTQVGGPDTATIVSPAARSTELQFPEMQGVYSFRLAVSNDAFTGTGIIKVLNYADIGPDIVVGRQLYVTIGGVEYVTGIAED